MRFIDWLSVTQEHPRGGLPVVGKEMITTYDLESGEIVRDSPNRRSLEGSYSSTVWVRCDGYRVTVDGNPSRWQRIDNLFGLRRFDDCIRVYNSILAEIGLPAFTKCNLLGWEQGPEDKKAKRVVDGAVFTRVDWTRNLAVGAGNVEAFLRALSTQTIGRGKYPLLYTNGKTVDWGKGSTYWYQKVYEKAEDLRRRLSKRNRKSLTNDEIKYLEKLIQYCDEMGVVREERELKSKFLKRKNLCYYGMVTEKDFEEYLDDVEHMIERLEMSTVDYESIADQLLEKEIVKSRQAANATQSYLYGWLHNKRSVSKSQFYTHRKRLLELGIDVSVPYDASKVIPVLKRQREIHVSTALPPKWYKMPKTQGLRIAA